jgi:hypothetical protein
MEGIFSLPYSEYEAINQIQKLFKKQDGYSILIPTSRQQKGIDFAILNLKNKKILKVQVKSSRSYLSDNKNSDQKSETAKYRYNFWFNNFIDKYEEGMADLYILFGLYPVYSNKENIKSNFWKNILLALTDKEMHKLLKNVKTKKEKKPDKFFGFSFDNEKHVYGTRGFSEKIDMSEFILKNKEKELKNLLK